MTAYTSCDLQSVAPQLPEYLQQCFLDALEKDRLRSMPNSYLPAAPVPRKGALLLGDALNMRYVVLFFVHFSALVVGLSCAFLKCVFSSRAAYC